MKIDNLGERLICETIPQNFVITNLLFFLIEEKKDERTKRQGNSVNFQTHLAPETFAAYTDSYLPTFRHNTSGTTLKGKKVKQSRYRPGVAQRVPER